MPGVLAIERLPEMVSANELWRAPSRAEDWLRRPKAETHT